MDAFSSPNYTFYFLSYMLWYAYMRIWGENMEFDYQPTGLQIYQVTMKASNNIQTFFSLGKLSFLKTRIVLQMV